VGWRRSDLVASSSVGDEELACVAKDLPCAPGVEVKSLLAMEAKNSLAAKGLPCAGDVEMKSLLEVKGLRRVREVQAKDLLCVRY
jgi:hypothetical protein